MGYSAVFIDLNTTITNQENLSPTPSPLSVLLQNHRCHLEIKPFSVGLKTQM
jgi:hypothetical protein